MLMPDVNVLVYAHREDADRHKEHARWLRSLAEGNEPFALSELVLHGFIRVVTNSRIFLRPTPLGGRVADACHAAVAIEHGCEWVTNDTDFARFQGLRWRTPANATLTGR
jgi:predicted nucleic acid-binding protein